MLDCLKKHFQGLICEKCYLPNLHLTRNKSKPSNCEFSQFPIPVYSEKVACIFTKPSVLFLVTLFHATLHVWAIGGRRRSAIQTQSQWWLVNFDFRLHLRKIVREIQRKWRHLSKKLSRICGTIWFAESVKAERDQEKRSGIGVWTFIAYVIRVILYVKIVRVKVRSALAMDQFPKDIATLLKNCWKPTAWNGTARIRKLDVEKS